MSLILICLDNISDREMSRFYFKTESDELNTNMIYYEIIDDTEEIPRWKGLIWAKIEIDHNEVL
ncbi:hypothetical protein Smp_142540 [Schistosoma mansoni]|uniref:hypothetical protein n=1 Tax=Schistosoma mansoni TaxID=6183 RepID=UPI0001A6376F|nr:hypothetical protein Smp_142540 [Schistosoma mansoni]|eukprot:XP_018644229.1 hypothetical protein Smp_142540 [Schistosoma mansoni]